MHETAMLPSSPPSAPQPVAISGSSQDVAFIAESASVAAAGDATGWGEAKKWTVDWKPVLLLALLLVVLYHTIAFKLVDDWYELPDFSHGFLIPFFALAFPFIASQPRFLYFYHSLFNLTSSSPWSRHESSFQSIRQNSLQGESQGS